MDAARREGLPVSWSPKGVPENVSPSLVIKVDDGDIDNYKYNSLECPTVWWFVDPNTDIDRGVHIGKNFDLTFSSQLCHIEDIEKKGIENVLWMPLACDPAHHSTIFNNLSDRPFDLGFSGSVSDCGGWNKGRVPLLTKIAGYFRNSVIRGSLKGQNSMINGSCKVIIDDNPYNNLNMRHFEAISSGAILVTRKTKDNGFEHLGPNTTTLFYENENEAIDKIKHALVNIKDFEEDSKNMMEFYQSQHSYSNRLNEIIKIVSGNL